ncbi:MAG: hypothetical protein FJY75_04275 [Candidatus Eisenbacteria bacterium]|uniref:Uncharacterized protein n=1 Tax=Eiseniibacteriota bacterium TaxID=2212470 RepID=A0A937X8C3_UNCEI|nr:hypothetical protein [Candidatus Eisenbacteria bacterium]
MSTFVVRFMRTASGAFRGRVRHVRTGEEAAFSGPADLVAFMEGMLVVTGLGSASEAGDVAAPYGNRGGGKDGPDEEMA